MPFDLNALMEDPQFQMGLGIYGTSSPRNAPLLQAYTLLQARKRAESEDAYKKALIKQAEQHSQAYAAQVAEQKRKNDQQQVFVDMMGKYIPQVMGGITGTPNASGQPTPQPPQGFGQPTANEAAGGKFSWADKFVSGIEKGFVPNDSGKGPTNFGINQKANPDVNVKGLDAATAANIRQQRYWSAINGDNLPPATAAVAYDAAINQGQDYARQLLEKTGGDPALMLYQRRQDYAQLAKSNPFLAQNLKGWNSRLDQLSEYVKSPTTPSTQPTAQPKGLAPHQQLSIIGGLAQIAAGDHAGIATMAGALKPDYEGERVDLEKQGLVVRQRQAAVDEEKEKRLAREKEVERNAQFSKDKAAHEMVGTAADRMVSAVDSIIKHPGLRSITGFSAMTNPLAVPGSNAYGALKELESLRAKVVNDTLQSVRQASANGASGYGQFTEKELEIVASYVASLDPGSPDFVKNLEQVKKYAEEIRSRADNLYEGSTGKSAIEGLPPGSRMIGTSGGKKVYQLPDGRKVVEK